MLLAISQCTRSVISASRPEEPSPARPREEAEDFRAADSGVINFLHTDSSLLTNRVSTYMMFLTFLLRESSRVILVLCSLFSTQAVSEASASQVQLHHNTLCCLLLRIELFQSPAETFSAPNLEMAFSMNFTNLPVNQMSLFRNDPLNKLLAFTLIFPSSGFFC